MKAKFFALMAVVLAVVSCQKDVDSLDVNMGGDVATISVTLPENAITRAAADETNSAWSGLQNVKEETLRVIFQVYDENGVTNENLRQVKTLTEGETSANFDVRLVPDRQYTFVAWADQGEEYFDAADLKNVQIRDWDAMDECRDAYTATHTEEKFNSASNITLTLTRPFAKLRVVTTDMAELGYLGIAPAEAEVEYTVALPIAFNAFAGEAGTTTTNKTFANFDIAEYNQDSANTMTLFTDYILVPANNVVKFSLKTMQDGGREIKTNNFNTDIPVKRNNLTTIAGNILTDGNNINVEVKPEFDGEHSINGDSQKVEETLKQNLKNINIDLTEDIALNGNGVKWGGEDTELIVIDGKKLATTAATGASNGNHTLTLNTTYRLHIETVNPNAKVIFRNLNITTNKESGTWDTYDIQFNCNVDIENVNFQKAIAFVKDGQSVTMKDVTINETHDYYAMWISAVGQTINIDNLVVNSEGRGIKIDEEYLDAAEIAKVNLNINNAKFTTKKKAAIMVKTVEGANITLSNIDITGVADDAVNAVWIDEDAKDYFDKVTVVGGSMAIEGETTIKGEDAQTTFANAVKEANAVVQLSAGEYTIPANIAEGVTIICEQGTVFNNPSKMNLNGATIIGAKFNSDNGSIVNSGQVNGTFKSCVFEGKKNVLREGYAGKTCVFEDCYFKDNGNGFVFHFDGAATGVTNAKITCRRCTFDGGKVALAGTIAVEMEDCEFINCSYVNTYGNSTFNNCNFNDTNSVSPLGKHATYNGCTYKGEALSFNALHLYSSYDCMVTVDDKDYAVVSTHANFEDYVNNATRDINVYITKTLTSKNVTLKQKENVNVYVTSWGDKKFFSGATLYIHGNARYDGAETMTFENIHFSSFATRDLISSDSTESVERYAHNLTFKNCFFEGDNGIDVVGLRLRQAYNITIENCETRNLHSLGQITSVVGLTVKNTTVNAFRGFNLLTSAQDAVFEGVTINATKEDGYGIRVDAAAGSEMTIKNSAITAYEPIVLRNAQAGFVLDMKGNNTITANGEYQLVINGETPTLIGAEGLTTNLQ